MITILFVHLYLFVSNILADDNNEGDPSPLMYAVFMGRWVKRAQYENDRYVLSNKSG